MANDRNGRPHWGSNIGFVLAAAGSAIGLGNIWKFPYITGQNGGGAFVLIYLLCIAVVGLPIFLAELYIGRKAQTNAVSAFAACHRPDSPWRWIGALCVISAFLILSFYSVVGGWILDFFTMSLFNRFAGRTDQEIAEVSSLLFAQPWTQIAWHAAFMAITAAIVIKGVKKGIERWSKILMPSLAGLLGILLVRSFFLEGFGDSLHFLFAPDFSKLTGHGVLEAVGHSFFTLSLGMGAMITYGSYLDPDRSLVKSAATIGIMDTLIALTAGLVIFSVVFSYGMGPEAGPTLMFRTLPVLFAKLPGGYFVSVGFFLLVAFAALTSAVSLLEVVVAYGEESLKWSRSRTTIVTSVIIFVLGILCALSTNVLADFKILGLTFFDLFDQATSRFALPFGGLMISLFYGWVLGPRAVAASIGQPEASLAAKGLLWTARICAPVAVAATIYAGFFG